MKKNKRPYANVAGIKYNTLPICKEIHEPFNVESYYTLSNNSKESIRGNSSIRTSTEEWVTGEKRTNMNETNSPLTSNISIILDNENKSKFSRLRKLFYKMFAILKE